jgi:hypothetical protein
LPVLARGLHGAVTTSPDSVLRPARAGVHRVAGSPCWPALNGGYGAKRPPLDHRQHFGGEERRKIATHVVDNSGDRASLEREVDDAWADLQRRSREAAAGE